MKEKDSRPSDEEVSRVATKLFLEIAKEWNLSDDEISALLGLKGTSLIDDWRQTMETDDAIPLSDSVLERLAYLAGVYKRIQQLFSEPEQWKSWIRKPNRDFCNRSALDYMLSGKLDDLKKVHRYLDSWQGEQYL
jgi:hypothetical protein